MDILINYLDSIKDMSEGTKEQTYRGELKKLIESFKTQENIEIIHEPNNDKSGLGAPDYWIRKNGLSLGYIKINA